MRRVPIQDVFALQVPEAVDIDDPDVRAGLPLYLNTLAVEQTWKQYRPWQKPSDLEFHEIDWLITKEPTDVETFQPAHDCAACRAGNDQALAFLRENPGRYIALANISYDEVWDRREV